MSYYIHPDSVKAIRKAIRDMYPIKDGWRWSVTSMDDNVGVVVALLQYPEGHNFPEHLVLDHHNVEQTCAGAGLGERESTIMVVVGTILMTTWQQGSFYPQLRIGSWNEAAVQQTNEE